MNKSHLQKTNSAPRGPHSLGASDLRKLLGSRCINLWTKCLIYKSLIRPVVTYGAECWMLTMKDELQLAVCERKVLRKTFGLI
jgi:hypothetical protein